MFDRDLLGFHLSRNWLAGGGMVTHQFHGVGSCRGARGGKGEVFRILGIRAGDQPAAELLGFLAVRRGAVGGGGPTP